MLRLNKTSVCYVVVEYTASYCYNYWGWGQRGQMLKLKTSLKVLSIVTPAPHSIKNKTMSISCALFIPLLAAVVKDETSSLTFPPHHNTADTSNIVKLLNICLIRR
ncbi:MAG: hypothetical protein JSW24_04140 [Dehalococcoidia bacterium]|nr:MAG: hypothetical protein JSW24_04140 [Dehalococcoidia bacterium]